MNLTINEKKILYVWGCSNYQNTIVRLAYAAALMTEPEMKHRISLLRDKLIEADMQEYYTCFYHRLRMEMKEYYCLKDRLHHIECSTLSSEEVQYDEAV
jgi:hypothetical protein